METRDRSRNSRTVKPNLQESRGESMKNLVQGPDRPGPGPSGTSDQDSGVSSYMVVQMLTIMKRKAVIS